MTQITRALRFVFRNWPLKVAAVAFATLLYTGIVLSQATRTFPGLVPIEAVNQARDVTLLSDLGAVRQIRFFAPEDLGLRIESSTFRATVDLSGVEATGATVSLPVLISPVDPRIQVIDYEPSRIAVRLDRVVERTVPIVAVVGAVPPTLDTGTAIVERDEGLVTGAQSIVARVAELRALVQIDASGIDVNRVIDLVAVDTAGEPILAPVDIEPASVRVRVPVFTDRQTKTLAVTPQVVGTPAGGFELASPIVVEPAVVSVTGDANDLDSLDSADTVPIEISGATGDIVRDVGLQLPEGVEAIGATTVRVTIRLRAITGTRTVQAGLVLRGARADAEYTLSTDRVLVTVGGSLADVERLSAASLTVNVDVSGLGGGTYSVAPTASLPSGLTLLGISPTPVSVTVSIVSPPTPPPPPTPSPTPAP